MKNKVMRCGAKVIAAVCLVVAVELKSEQKSVNGSDYVALEIDRIKQESDTLFGDLLSSPKEVQNAAEFTAMFSNGSNDTTDAYNAYKEHRDRISKLQEQLALLKSRDDYAELQDRKDLSHYVVLGRYVEAKLAKAREVAKAQYEWQSFRSEYAEYKDDGAKSRERELLRKWQGLQDELSEILPSSIQNAAPEKEDPAVLYKRGKKYYDGDGVEKDYAYAFKCFKAAAEQGYARAQYNLGLMYLRGEGVEYNYDKGKEWYRKAAEQGDVEAQYQLALKLSVEENYDEEVYWLRKAVEQGDANAQMSLAFCYSLGRGVAKDDAKAVELMRKAAVQGCNGAACSLARDYYNGSGCKQDYYEAFRWFLKAAEYENDVEAQYMLGVMYENGDGIAQNYSTAIEWYRKAAEQDKGYVSNAAKQNIKRCQAKQMGNRR